MSKVKALIQTHRKLMSHINDMSEKELLQALKIEKAKDGPRKSMMHRLYTKYATARQNRERAELQL